MTDVSNEDVISDEAPCDTEIMAKSTFMAITEPLETGLKWDGWTFKVLGFSMIWTMIFEFSYWFRGVTKISLYNVLYVTFYTMIPTLIDVIKVPDKVSPLRLHFLCLIHTIYQVIRIIYYTYWRLGGAKIPWYHANNNAGQMPARVVNLIWVYFGLGLKDLNVDLFAYIPIRVYSWGMFVLSKDIYKSMLAANIVQHFPFIIMAIETPVLFLIGWGWSKYPDNARAVIMMLGYFAVYLESMRFSIQLGLICTGIFYQSYGALITMIVINIGCQMVNQTQLPVALIDKYVGKGERDEYKMLMFKGSKQFERRVMQIYYGFVWWATWFVPMIWVVFFVYYRTYRWDYLMKKNEGYKETMGDNYTAAWSYKYSYICLNIHWIFLVYICQEILAEVGCTLVDKMFIIKWQGHGRVDMPTLVKRMWDQYGFFFFMVVISQGANQSGNGWLASWKLTQE